MQQLVTTSSQHLVDPPEIIHTVVVFINSGSGGKTGSDLLSSGSTSRQLNEVFSANLYIFKIDDPRSRRRGLQFVDELTKKVRHSVHKIIVMAGGGDGTVNWLLTQIINSKIDYTKLAFGALPLGTGNDFAKNLGWTQVTLFDGQQGLKEFFSNIKKSTLEDFDVWEIEVSHHVGGSIVQIKEGGEKAVQDTPIVKQMTNYFSFGMDARVGYNFDKQRSNFQAVNLLLYCLLGFCNRFKKLPSVERVVANMEENPQKLDEQINLLFTSSVDKLHLKKFRNLLALNINSYMGGVKGVWQNSKESGLKRKLSQPSNHSDGLLEFVAFKHEWSLGFQRLFKGQARKIAQGGGVFKLDFDENCHQTYLNFDGQYFKIYKPKTVVIKKSPYFSDTKLRVIRCPEP